jgi:hypothetical protein
VVRVGPGLIAQSIGLPLQVATLALVIRALRHGSRRTIGVAATAVAALALLHPISILVRPVPGDLLQPAREEPLAFGLTATVVEQQPAHLRWTAEARGRLAVVAAVTYDPGWPATVDDARCPSAGRATAWSSWTCPPASTASTCGHRRPSRPAGVVLTLAGLLALALLRRGGRGR